MNSVCLKISKQFFLFTTFIFAVTGCGSGSSSSSTANNETGSIAAKLVWSSPGAKTTAKTLYAVPTEVTSIKISVYYDIHSIDDDNLITSKTFDPRLVGSGTITGIPAGSGRAIKVEGLGSHSGYPSVLISLGTEKVDVVAGQTKSVTITMEAPVTSASPAPAPPAASFPVTLTASVPATIYYTTNEPATIYYTTNGYDPSIFNSGSPNPATVWITPPRTLKFFAKVNGLYESIKTVVYP